MPNMNEKSQTSASRRLNARHGQASARRLPEGAQRCEDDKRERPRVPEPSWLGRSDGLGLSCPVDTPMAAQNWFLESIVVK